MKADSDRPVERLCKKRTYHELGDSKEFISIAKNKVPTYLQSGDFFQSLADDEDVIDVPGNCCMSLQEIKSTTELQTLFLSLRFWLVEDIPIEGINYMVTTPYPQYQDVADEFKTQLVCLDKYIEICRQEQQECRLRKAVELGVMPVVHCLWTPTVFAKDRSLCEVAAGNGRLECLQFAHENGCVLSDGAASKAAINGHMDCLKYVLTHVKKLFPSLRLCDDAVRGGHLEVLKYLMEEQHTYGSITINFAAAYGHTRCLLYLHSQGCDLNHDCARAAAYFGQLGCLKVLHQLGCPWTQTAPASAAENGYLDCLTFLHEHGCPWDVRTTTAAVQHDQLDCLLYALCNNCPCSVAASRSAAAKGDGIMLAALHLMGAPWDSEVCRVAALQGHLDVLTYAHENGCDWDEGTTVAAARYGQLECLQYAHQHGCPVTAEARMQAALKGKKECLAYLHKIEKEYKV